MNNYIADIPMRFSNRYMSLQVDNTLLENSNGEDFVKFKIEDVSFYCKFVILTDINHDLKLYYS